jgi:hypothetical protein
MSTVEALLAAARAAQVEQPLEGSSGGNTVPVPDEQVQVMVTLLREAIAGGKTTGHVVTIPLAFWRPDGVTNAPWAPRANPAQGYATAVRAVLCAAVGGDGSALWVSQFTAYGPEPVQVEGQAPLKRPTIGAGLQLRGTIPAKAKVLPGFEHLKAAS